MSNRRVTNMTDSVVDIFLQCDQAVRRGQLIHRTSRVDKEFHFQNWFQTRLDEIQVMYDAPARNSYPDFRLVHSPVGYEVKGLAYSGREATYGANSQMPTDFTTANPCTMYSDDTPRIPTETITRL